MTYRRRLVALVLATSSACGAGSAAAQSSGGKKATKAAKAKPSKPDEPAARFGVGGGLHVVYPPMLTVQGLYRHGRLLEVGAEAGWLSVPVEEFSGTSTYVGLDAKALLAGGLYVGFAVGRRSFEITTVNGFAVNGVDNDVAWTRQVSQTVLYPRLGWSRVSAGGHGVTLGAGYVMPVGSSFSMTRDREIEGGAPPALVAEEEAKRAEDVRRVTHASTPSVEVKYVFFFKPS